MPRNEEPQAAPESLNLDGIGDLFPPVDETVREDERLFDARAPRRSKLTAGDRLRDALHWMGI